jgi:hypothetical protein
LNGFGPAGATIGENLGIVTRGTGPIAFTTYTYGLITGGLGDYYNVIIDAGTSATEWNQHADRNVIVTRLCYLAVRGRASATHA